MYSPSSWKALTHGGGGPNDCEGSEVGDELGESYDEVTRLGADECVLGVGAKVLGPYPLPVFGSDAEVAAVGGRGAVTLHFWRQVDVESGAG